MNVVETMYILLKGDSTQLKTGIRDVDKQVEVLGRRVTNTDQRLARMLRRSISVLAVFGGFKAAFDYSENLYKASEALGVNIEELGVWSAAAEKAGAKAETFQQSLSAFAQKFNLTADEALSKLPELAEKLQAVGKIQALKIGKELGFDEQTIALLSKGRAAIEDLIKRQRELGVVSKEDAKIIHDFSVQWKDTTQVFNIFSTQMLGTILPVLGRFFTHIQNGLIELRKYPYLIEGLTYGLTALSAILGLVAIKSVLAFLPFGIFGGVLLAVGAAALFAYDDIKTFINGGDSLIGAALEKWPELAGVFDAIVDSVKYLEKALFGAIDTLKMLFDLVNHGGLFNGNNLFDFEGVNTAGGVAPGTITSTNSLYGPPPVSAAGSSNSSNTVNLSGDIVVNAQTSDPKQLGKLVYQTLEDQVRSAMASNDDGVMG